MLLVETIFDTLNARAAFFAIQKIFDERGIAPLSFRRGELRESHKSELQEKLGARVTRPPRTLNSQLSTLNFPFWPPSRSSRRAATAA